MFGHYKTLKKLLGKYFHQQYKHVALCKSDKSLTLNSIFRGVGTYTGGGGVSDMLE